MKKHRIDSALASDALPVRKRYPRKSPRVRLKVPIKPMIVDVLTNRLTVPTPSGKQFPVLIGAGATSALMFIALNPGCTVAEVREALEITPASFQSRIERLREMGLVIGNRYYQMNLGVRHEVVLVRFLRALGAAYDLQSGSNGTPLRGAHANRAIVTPLPDDLFGTATRTRILMLIAALGESYLCEMRDLIGLFKMSGVLRLAELLNEGVLRMRRVGHLKVYGLNPHYPGAALLRVLLRRMAIDSPFIRAAANAGHVRRHALGEDRDWRRDVFADLTANAKDGGWTAHGVRREFGGRAWRFAEGLSIARPWKKTPNRRPRPSPKRTPQREGLQ